MCLTLLTILSIIIIYNIALFTAHCIHIIDIIYIERSTSQSTERGTGCPYNQLYGDNATPAFVIDLQYFILFIVCVFSESFSLCCLLHNEQTLHVCALLNKAEHYF